MTCDSCRVAAGASVAVALDGCSLVGVVAVVVAAAAGVGDGVVAEVEVAVVVVVEGAGGWVVGALVMAGSTSQED